MLATMPRSFSSLAVLFSFCVCPAVAQKVKDGENEGEKQQLQLKACGPREKEVMYTAGTDKHTHPTPEPSDGKAMIYVIRPTIIGNKVQTKLAVDGDWKGVNRGNNYFFFSLDPGEHLVCSISENRSVEKIAVEAGKTYFLQQHIHSGMMKARNTVEILSEEDGRKALAKCHPSTWEIK